ncbi:MAG: vWA domain-containing protein [Nanobdellota archaeon]
MMRNLRKKRATYFGNIKTLQRTHGFKVFHVSIVVLIVKIIVIFLLFMIGTNSVAMTDIQPVTTTDYVLLIDDSSSMAKSDYDPNRLSSAKEISKRWLTVLPNSTKVGMASFSKNIDYSAELTTNKKEVSRAIDDIEINYGKSGTDLDHAINYGIDLLQESTREKTLLLLTDGTEPIANDTIHKSIDENIKIIAFGIGKQEEQDIPSEYSEFYDALEFNFTLLQNITAQTGGNAYQVENEADLKKSLNEATYEEVSVPLNSSYYITLLIMIISIAELYLYSRIGAL